MRVCCVILSIWTLVVMVFRGDYRSLITVSGIIYTDVKSVFVVVGADFVGLVGFVGVRRLGDLDGGSLGKFEGFAFDA
jgi:hypothetical protein